jgi:hypothetical protein
MTPQQQQSKTLYVRTNATRVKNSKNLGPLVWEEIENEQTVKLLTASGSASANRWPITAKTGSQTIWGFSAKIWGSRPAGLGGERNRTNRTKPKTQIYILI